ncbi:3',5'-cyclic adenosine monophosphate phosphodiesterase CpdA [compost metagenome]
MQLSKIQYASDLHLEFPQNKEFIKSNPLLPKGDILILAGDIVPFAIMDKHEDFFSYLVDNFQMTYWIPGNHEYYYFDAINKSGVLFEKIRSNVILLNNMAVQLQDTKFIFSTLWSKITPANQWSIERGLSDFHVIKYNGDRLTSKVYNQWHLDAINFVNQELQLENQGKTVVVTHHVPTFMNYPEQYKSSTLNEAFAVELFDTIEDSGVDYWLYGHSHYNTSDFKIGNTQLLTNQLGYVQRKENVLFNPEKYFEI